MALLSIAFRGEDAAPTVRMTIIYAVKSDESFGGM
jgi:hypothetical protein